MAIEWPTAPTESGMTVEVPDNWPTPPAGPPDTLVASVPCNVNINWTVPQPYSTLIGGAFQLRAYVESIGPGQEIQLGCACSSRPNELPNDYRYTWRYSVG
jgi:hypothetical protein